jgi:hypothetical protein
MGAGRPGWGARAPAMYFLLPGRGSRPAAINSSMVRATSPGRAWDVCFYSNVCPFGAFLKGDLWPMRGTGRTYPDDFCFFFFSCSAARRC